MNEVKKAQVLSKAQAPAYAALTTVSAKIRYLAAEGYDRGSVSRIMTELEGRLVRYQHVRNVLITPLKREV